MSPRLVNTAPDRFFQAASEAYGHAARGGSVHRDYRIHRWTLRLRFTSTDLAEALTPAIDHLRVEGARQIDFEIRCWHDQVPGRPMPAMPWNNTDILAQGHIRGFNEGPFRTVYQHGTDALNMIDLERGTGLFWVRDLQLPDWEKAAPLRNLLHWWSQEHGLQFMHAAAVGEGGDCVLIVGPGGSGKSTTALAALMAGMDYAGDDYVLLETGEAPRVHALYASAKLEPQQLGRFPELGPHARHQGGDKTILMIASIPGRQMAHPMRIRAVLVPRVTGGPVTRITGLNGGEALRALAPSTLFQLPGGRHHAFRQLSALARRLPCHRLELGTEMPGVVSALRQALRP
ncbi:hypothetical protein [Thioalkalivibrio thiocyanodenitrificans]|uniref:hypothetical protein n=1 Tax=Thioalkalivibrio thiocyanodenitrificans TaxID=243063 RepID=UPI00035C1778|nr:hypothetical protein [Thioalkalivibrio thiocyanodenitrificans]